MRKYLLVLLCVVYSYGSNFDHSEKYFLNYLFTNEYLWANEIEKKDYLNYKSPKEMIELYKVSKDKWSYSTLYHNLISENEFRLKGFGLHLTNNARVFDIDISSPAYNSFIRRGDIILELNDMVINPTLYLELEKKLQEKVKFKINRNGEIINLELMPLDYSDGAYYNFTVGSKTIFQSINGRRIGHFIFNSFAFDSMNHTNSVDLIEESFEYFNQNNIDELVIDLRYNTGGSLSAASILLDKIAGKGRTDEVQFYTKWNDQNREKNKKYRFSEDNNSVSLERVFFLTSDKTASASEVVINALKPYIDVVVIGKQTHGKPIGNIGRKNHDIVYNIPNFYIYNVDDSGEYFNGIETTCQVDDDLKYERMNLNDNLLNAALYYLEHSSCPSNEKIKTSLFSSFNGIDIRSLNSSFLIENDAYPNKEYTSSPIKLGGIDKEIEIKAFNSVLIKNGEEILTNVTTGEKGDLIQLRLKASNSLNSSIKGVVTLSNAPFYERVFTINTSKTFFEDIEYADVNTFYKSNILKVEFEDTKISIDNGVLIKNNIELLESKTIANKGDIIQVKLESSNLNNTKVESNISLNSIVDKFSIKTYENLQSLENNKYNIEDNEKIYSFMINTDGNIDISFNWNDISNFSSNNEVFIYDDERNLIFSTNQDQTVFLKKGNYLLKMRNKYETVIYSPLIDSQNQFEKLESKNYSIKKGVKYFNLEVDEKVNLEVYPNNNSYVTIYDESLNIIAKKSHLNRITKLNKGNYHIKVLNVNNEEKDLGIFIHSISSNNSFDFLINKSYELKNEIKYYNLNMISSGLLDITSSRNVDLAIYDNELNIIENDGNFDRTLLLKKGKYIVKVSSFSAFLETISFRKIYLDDNYEELTKSNYKLNANEQKYYSLNMKQKGTIDINPSLNTYVTIFDKNLNLVIRGANLIRTVFLKEGEYIIKVHTNNSNGDVSFYIPKLNILPKFLSYSNGTKSLKNGVTYYKLVSNDFSKLAVDVSSSNIFNVSILDEDFNILKSLTDKDLEFSIEKDKTYILKIINNSLSSSSEHKINFYTDRKSTRLNSSH